MGQALHRALLQAGLEAHLQHEIGDQGDHVGIAAALAQPVDACPGPGARRRARRPAYWRPRSRCRCGSGCRAARRGIFFTTSLTMRSISCGRVPPLVSHSTSQRAPSSARRAAHRRIVGIGLVAVEEMLGVEHHLVYGVFAWARSSPIMSHDSRPVELERDVDMEVPGLADQADGACAGRQDRQGRDRSRRCGRPAASCRRRRTSRSGTWAVRRKTHRRSGLAPGQPPSI